MSPAFVSPPNELTHDDKLEDSAFKGDDGSVPSDANLAVTSEDAGENVTGSPDLEASETAGQSVTGIDIEQLQAEDALLPTVDLQTEGTQGAPGDVPQSITIEDQNANVEVVSPVPAWGESKNEQDSINQTDSAFITEQETSFSESSHSVKVNGDVSHDNSIVTNGDVQVSKMLS